MIAETAPKVAVIGNCQAGSIAAVLDRSVSCELACVIDLNLQGSESFAHAEHRVVHVRDLDFVFTQNLADAHGSLATERLKDLYKDKLITHTNIYFNGLHPDIMYFGAFRKRVESPIGDYHSKICLAAYLRKMSKKNTIELFHSATYRTFGYFDEYEKSLAELRSRDTNLDVKFSGRMSEIIKEKYSLFSVNHPTLDIISPLSDALLRHATGRGLGLFNHLVGDKLADNCVWPIYPEIGNYWRLPYETPMIFFPPIGIGRKGFSLEHFIERSFSLYDEQRVRDDTGNEVAQALLRLDL